MKLSVSTWAFNDKTREEALERIGAMGVEGVEIIAHAPPFHVHTDLTDELVGYVKGLLAANKLKISAISPSTEFLQFSEDTAAPGRLVTRGPDTELLQFDEEGMEAQLDHMRKVVELAARLGADHVRVFPGGRVPEDRSQEECIQAVVYGLQESVKIAEAKDIKLSAENHGQFGGNYELFKPVMDAVPPLGITLHTNRLAQMDNYLDYVREFAPRVMHTHLNDIAVARGEGERPRPVALGEGALDVPAILEILQDAGYSGYWNLEYGGGRGDPTPLIEKSLAYLTKALA